MTSTDDDILNAAEALMALGFDGDGVRSLSEAIAEMIDGIEREQHDERN